MTLPGAALAACMLLGAAACGPDTVDTRARLSLDETLGGADTTGYARAVEPRPFEFPRDHGPHPDFRNEWWYITGNLETEEGREAGFQFTIFRSALSPRPREGTSAWGTRQAYMAHLAVTDVQGRRFHAFERFARGAVGLAGAQAEPFRVWLEDWALETAGGSPDGFLPVRLQAGEDSVSLDLILEPGKPLVLQGEEGLSQKGPERGNASYYYSFTRLPTRGTVVLGADTLRVTGSSWFDREWSTSALSQGQVGWDWFALQLDPPAPDQGWDLMVYALRQADGSAHPLSDGVLVDPRGNARALTWGQDVTVTPTAQWTSPLDGSVYPAAWRVEVPGEEWVLDVTPVLDDQELDLAFRYWEGAVRVTGRGPDGPISGRGYVELTGYAGTRPER